MTDASSLPTRNPRSGASDYLMPVYNAAQVADVANALRQAQTDWAALSLQQRLAALAELIDAIDADRDALVQALSQDTGRQQESAMEVNGVQNTLRRWLATAPALMSHEAPRRSQVPSILIEQHRRPYVLAGVISPWNFPLMLSMIDAIPALAVGCAVMVKPSEATPRFVPVFQKTIARVPALSKVLGFVTGPGQTGEALIRNSDLICFTGSVRTGRRVCELAAQCFIPAHLELGGKDPAIVCADADIAQAARALAWGSMVNAGQSCQSIERCYVHRSIFTPFVAALQLEVSGLKSNFLEIDQGQIGPIIAGVQAPIVQRHLSQALSQGAKAVVGGQVREHHGGLWCEPTVLVDVTPEMAIMTEETFAAILPVMPFETEEEAVQLANSSIFGLSACVFSRDIERAKNIAAQLHAGAVSINDASLTAIVHDAAKQSFKASGLGGSRMGAPSLQRFYRQQAFMIKDGGADSPWWYPKATDSQIT